MNPPRLAFIGSTYSASPWLLHALRRHGTFEAVCDENPRRDPAALQARWTFTELDALLCEAEPDGVVVHLPPQARHGVVKRCLSAGASVLLQGVPCTAARFERLFLIAKLAGQRIFTAPAMRFAPAMLLARRLIESGRFGQPLSIALHSTRRGAPRESLDDQGPVPADQVFEAADLVNFFVGPLFDVTSVAQPEGAILCVGRTQGQVPVSIVLHASGPPETLGIEIELRSLDGTCLRIDRDGGLSCGNGSRVDAHYQPTLVTSDPAVELGFDGLVGEFVRQLGAGTYGDGATGNILIATEAILTSARTGRRVQVRSAEVGGRRSMTPVSGA